MNVGKSIKIALINREMSNQELAHRLDVTPSYISAIANNRKTASEYFIGKIAKALGYTLTKFLALGETTK